MYCRVKSLSRSPSTASISERSLKPTGKQGRSVARGLHHDYHVVGTTRCLEGDKATATKAEFPEMDMMCCDLTKPDQVRAVFKAHPNAAAAFLVTNYYDESMQGDGVEERAAVECATLNSVSNTVQ